MSTPDVFEIRKPYTASNSGAGHDDPEYAAMKSGARLDHIEAGRNEAWFVQYRSTRYVGTQRYGVAVYQGLDLTVHSYRRIKDARKAYSEAKLLVLGPSSQPGDVAAE